MLSVEYFLWLLLLVLFLVFDWYSDILYNYGRKGYIVNFQYYINHNIFHVKSKSKRSSLCLFTLINYEMTFSGYHQSIKQLFLTIK